MIIEKICKSCGKKFTINKRRRLNTAKFCSNDCKYPKRIIIKCKRCKKHFAIIPSSKDTVKFCSNICKYPQKIKIKCNICNKNIITSPSRKGRKKFCSEKCRNIGLKNSNTKKLSKAEKDKLIHLYKDENVPETEISKIMNIDRKILRRTRLKMGITSNPSGFMDKNLRARVVVPKKDTKIEVKIQKFLRIIGIDFTTHKYIKEIKYKYQCDIFIPIQEGITQKTIIECDGDYWHGNLEVSLIKRFNKSILSQRCLDYERTAQLEEAGFRIIRLWENKIKKIEINELQRFLK